MSDAILDLYQDTLLQASIDERKKNWCRQMVNALTFFGKYLAQVELKVNQHDVQRFYFVFPFSSSFLSSSTIHHVIQYGEKHNYETGEQRFQRLLPMAAYFDQEVQFRQTVSQHLTLNYLSLRRDLFRNLSLILIIVINISYLVDLVILDSHSQLQHEDMEWVNTILTILQLLFALTMLLIEGFNKFPQISFKIKESKAHYAKKQIFKYSPKQQDGLIEEQETDHKEKHFKKWEEYCNQNYLIVYLMDLELLYYILYFCISLISVYSQSLTSVLLFDIIKRNKELQSVLKSVVINYKQIFLIFLLASFIIYCYAFMGFEFFWSSYDEIQSSKQRYFYQIFAYTIHYGMIKPGFDPFMLEKIEDDRLYWSIYFFSLSFCLIMSLVFLALIIGLISGTYSQIHSIQKSDDFYSKCRICGSTQQQFDAK